MSDYHAIVDHLYDFEGKDRKNGYKYKNGDDSSANTAIFLTSIWFPKVVECKNVRNFY